MSMKRYKPEQIVTLLRQIEVEIANGKTTPQACQEAEITAQTYYRWRKEFGGLKLDQAKRLKELEKENSRVEAAGGGAFPGEAGSAGCGAGKLLSPERRRCAVEHAREEYGLSERHACRLLGQWRGTQRYLPILRTRRGCADAGDHHAGQRVRPLWLSADHGAAARGGLAGGQGPGAADLAAGRAESAAETEAARTVVAERWLVRAAAAGAGESCLELRLRQRHDARRQDACGC